VFAVSPVGVESTTRASTAVRQTAQTAQTAQDKPAIDLSKLELYLDKAQHGSAVIRPQAAARLVPMGGPAAERLFELCGADPAAMAEMGASLVEVLGAFDDPRLRERLWQGIADPDFPWRPAAARSLAQNLLQRAPTSDAGSDQLAAAQADEARRFRALLEDPIAPVRVAAVQALEKRFPEPDMGLRAAARARLADTSDFVRRAAAVALVGWGEPEALLWLVEDLRRSDTFFERWSGKNAAYESRRALQALLGDTFGYDPEVPPSDATNVAALAQLDAAVRARIGERAVPVLPNVARASGPEPDAVLGLELISCRRGEHYIAWTSDDQLLVGIGNPARVELPEGTTARLLGFAKEQVAQLDRPYFGLPGCDVEMLRIVSEPGARAQSWVVSKNQARIEGLRPEALGAVLRELIASLPEGLGASDPRLANLRDAAREAMIAIGGR